MLKRRLIIKNQTLFLMKLKKRTITALLEYQIPLTVTSSFLFVSKYTSLFRQQLLHLNFRNLPFQ